MQGANMFGLSIEGLQLVGFIGNLGMPELLIVGFIVLILFGSRLPSVMRSLGQGVVEFKKGVQGVDEEKESSDKASSEKT
jgi:sec-independent protein translocase protein TatA